MRRVELDLLELYHALLAFCGLPADGFLVEEENEDEQDALAWRPVAHC